MMAEYIDRDLVAAVIEEKQRALCPVGRYGRSYVYGRDREAYDEWGEILDKVEEIPAVSVAPVVHSRFVNMGGFPACERCGASPGCVEPKPNNPRGFPPYCYACGAKMDEEDK